MSYDVSLCAPLGPDGEMVPVGGLDANYTNNVSVMFYDAIGSEGIKGLHGRQCREVIPQLRAAIARMQDNPAKYRAMNPPNGWGDYEGAIRFLREILDACVDAPLAHVEVSY